jgi:hypothetical protein
MNTKKSPWNSVSLRLKIEPIKEKAPEKGNFVFCCFFLLLQVDMTFCKRSSHFTFDIFSLSHLCYSTHAVVYNMKSQQARLVALTPSDQWGGAGLLGVTIRLDNYAGAEDRLVRILTVEPQSPAAIAGLVPFKDFLLGTTHQTLNSSAELAALLRQHEDQVVELYVYNTDSDMVRVVALMPTLEWGGRGLLGAEVGTGYLHRLPSSARTTEGTSVERKVRYVGVLPTPTTSQSQQAQTSETTVAPTRTLLEVEPQLEMEVDHGEDDESEESAEEVEIPQKQPPPPDAATTTTQPAIVEPIQTTSVTTTASASEAEALFQRPPSQSAVSFPPPPKMHYT